jgi:hypothetical protein
MSDCGSEHKVISKATINVIAKRLTFFGRPSSGGQKVSVSPCGSVANKTCIKTDGDYKCVFRKY